MIGDFLGCWTALVTPFKEDLSIDWQGLEKNIAFQDAREVTGVVPVGTTGESPTLTPEEHNLVIARTWRLTGEEAGVYCLAGCGSNSTREALHYTELANAIGCDGVLLVDPYYNGPSSLEIRENYYREIAKRFPDLSVVPYIIPGRTGCALSPEDLAILARDCSNVRAVKEATGDLERMRKTRSLLPDDFQILSGDDDKTFVMMTDDGILAVGVISVISNIAPVAVSKMCERILNENRKAAEKIRDALSPLFGVVTVLYPREEEINGEKISIRDKFRNPLPIKTMMQGLGLPAGPCRPPLGKMTLQGVEIVRNALREVWEKSPWVLKPIEEFYGVDISERLTSDRIWQSLAY